MRRSNLCIAVAVFILATLPLAAQTLIATVPVQNDNFYLAGNPVTNMVYVTNTCGNDPSCGNSSPGTVSVINGVTNTIAATITVGIRPEFVVINPVTNKVYVSNRRDNTVSVIDGATNTVIKTVTVGSHPTVGDVNPVTNKIYFVNNGNGQGTTMSVIDGASDSVTATVTVGNYPLGVSVNSVTNTVYVSNYCGNQFGCDATPANGTVSVINGANNTVTGTVTVGVGPGVVFADPVTNKVYVQNSCGTTLTCDLDGNTTNVIGTVTQIDGATLTTATVTVGQGFGAMAINLVGNKVYASNNTDNTETIIDGDSLSTTTVSVGLAPDDVEVNPATNKIYVCNSGDNTVTTIDGATLATSTTNVGNTPVEAWVNPVSNHVFVSNVGDSTVSVLGGVGANALQFVPLTPCRVVDTRGSNGPLGGPAMPGGTFRDFPLTAGNCQIPSNAAGYSLNVTVVPLTSSLNYLTIWPTGEFQPTVSTLNSPDGRVKANAAIVPAGTYGSVRVFVTDSTDVILDIDGYFVDPSSSTLAFYPLAPCRVIDTRGADGDLGGPALQAQTERDFPVQNSSCIPQGKNIQAYSFNFTVVPNPANQPLGYLSVWPVGQSQPVVSTLNNPTATVVANAAIVPAGTGGAIAVYGYNSTDLVVDIDGYFAAPGTGGLSLYNTAPCRVLDTRANNGQPFTGTLMVPVTGSQCAPPSNAQAYVLNATVVPPGPMGYLTLWPDGTTQPTVSTLNAYDGFITSNMAIVPTNNGSIDAYASDLTQLILDISSYFAP